MASIPRRLAAALPVLLAVLVLSAGGLATWNRWSDGAAGPEAARWLPTDPVGWTRTGATTTSTTVAAFPGLPPGLAGIPERWPAAAQQPGTLTVVATSVSRSGSRTDWSSRGLLLDDDGVRLAQVVGGGALLAVEPAVRLLPDAPAAGESWSDTGRLLFDGTDEGSLTVSGTVERPPDGRGCVVVATTTTWSTALRPGEPAAQRSRDRWCPGGWSVPLEVDGASVVALDAAAVGDAVADLPQVRERGPDAAALFAAVGSDAWPAGGQAPAFAPVSAGDVVVVAPSEQNAVTALAESDGTPVWSQLLPGQPAAGPVVVGGTLVVSETSGGVWGLDPATGLVRWHRTGPPPAAASAGADAEAAGTVLVAAWDGTVQLLDAATGSERARTRVPGPVRTAVPDGSGWWLVSTDGRLTRLGADLAVTRRVELPGTAPSGPVAVAGAVVAVPQTLGTLDLVAPDATVTGVAVADPDDPLPVLVVASGGDLLTFSPGSGRAVLIRADGTRSAPAVPVVAAVGLSDDEQQRWLVITGRTVVGVLSGVADAEVALLGADGTVTDRAALPPAPDPDYPLQGFTTPVVTVDAAWLSSSAGLLRIPR